MSGAGILALVHDAHAIARCVPRVRRNATRRQDRARASHDAGGHAQPTVDPASPPGQARDRERRPPRSTGAASRNAPDTVRPPTHRRSGAAPSAPLRIRRVRDAWRGRCAVTVRPVRIGLRRDRAGPRIARPTASRRRRPAMPLPPRCPGHGAPSQIRARWRAPRVCARERRANPRTRTRMHVASHRNAGNKAFSARRSGLRSIATPRTTIPLPGSIRPGML